MSGRAGSPARTRHRPLASVRGRRRTQPIRGIRSVLSTQRRHTDGLSLWAAGVARTSARQGPFVGVETVGIAPAADEPISSAVTAHWLAGQRGSRPCTRGGDKITCQDRPPKLPWNHDMEPIIAESARRHGWADDDILHAYRQPVRVWPNADDDMDMIIGPIRSAA